MSILPLVRIAILPLLAASRLLCELEFREWRFYEGFATKLSFGSRFLRTALRKTGTFPRPIQQSTGLLDTPALPGPGFQVPPSAKRKGHPKGCPFLFGGRGGT